MTTFAWKILDVRAVDGKIVQARYFVSAKEGANVVETEGNWEFRQPYGNVPFEEVTEEMVIKWVEQEAVTDGKSSIETRLQEQMQYLKTQAVTVAPWMPQVFTPEL